MCDSPSCPNSTGEDWSGDVHESLDEQGTWDVEHTSIRTRWANPSLSRSFDSRQMRECLVGSADGSSSTPRSATPLAEKVVLKREEVSPTHTPALPGATIHHITADVKTSSPNGQKYDVGFEHTYDDSFLGDPPLSAC